MHEMTVHQLKQFLLKRNYPDKIVDDAIEQCKKLDRKDLLNPIQRNKTQSIIP